VIVDASAIIAIVRNEDDAARYSAAIEATEFCYMSAATYVEIAAVVDPNPDPILRHRFDDFMKIVDIEIVPVDREQAIIAREALRDFGKGSGHPARLNFGDSFSYALARSSRMPLLFKGNNFSKTDIESAI
jgi:ribonuclease VapC